MTKKTTPMTETEIAALIRNLYRLRENVQGIRKSLGNQINAETTGRSQNGRTYLNALNVYFNQFHENEKTIDDGIATYTRQMADLSPFMVALLNLRGIGPMLAAGLISYIDLERAESPSAIWLYAGLAPGRDRRVKGEKIAYNPRLKVLTYNIGVSFLRAGSPYRAIYDESIAYYNDARPDWTKFHTHLASLRRMNKRFYAHYYAVGRAHYGLPVRPPYVEEKLGHTHIDDPADYGWTINP